MTIDYTKAYITLADGTEWQVIGEDGETDMAATQVLIDEYLAGN